MREYVYSIVSFSSAAGLLLILLPSGTRHGLKKHVKLICALCLVCILIDPLSDLIGSIDELFSGDLSIYEDNGGELYERYEQIYQSYLDGSYGDNIGQVVKDALFEKFDIKRENCRVLTEFYDNNGDGVREPKRITVVLSGEDKFRDPETVKEFLSSVFECEIAAAIE